MKLRPLPVAVVVASLVVVGAVNVLAASATPSAPGGRLALVDPFAARAVAVGPPPDGSGAAAWARQVAALAVQAKAAPDEAAATGAATSSDGSAAAAPAGSTEGALTPVENQLAEGHPQPPQTLEAWVTSAAAATGIPARAVRAYGNAALLISQEDEACRLGWPTLAGIGAIESGHGTHGGATLGEDGRPTVPIVGPALDGSPGRAAIHAAADSVFWHGDPEWDHAVGPMQFIPSTWRKWGADGDADGVADPQDVDDAALAAARYLCAGSRDLSTWDGWRAAILSYNHSEDYVAQVYQRASGYASATAD